MGKKNIWTPFCRVLQKAVPTSDKILVPNLSGQLQLKNPVNRFEILLERKFSQKLKDFSRRKKSPRNEYEPTAEVLAIGLEKIKFIGLIIQP